MVVLSVHNLKDVLSDVRKNVEVYHCQWFAEVIASKSVLASVRESDVQLVDPSAEMLSKHATMDGCRSLNRSSASIRSIHLVRQRSFNFRMEDLGRVVWIASSSFLCR